MDGFQVLAVVRRKYPALRVAVVTGAEDEQFRARAYAMGVDLYIEKPKTGKEIINFVDCIESLLERETAGGFRGVQSKTLVDIIQLECLTQSSVILRITSAAGEGRLWIQKGDIVDAMMGELSGKEAFMEMLSWSAGNFEILPNDMLRPRTIFESYEGLLMETAQAMDEVRRQRPGGARVHRDQPVFEIQGGAIRDRGECEGRRRRWSTGRAKSRRAWPTGSSKRPRPCAASAISWTPAS